MSEHENTVPEGAKDFHAPQENPESNPAGSQAENPFEPTRYNPKPGETLPRLEQEDIEKEEAEKVEAEYDAELRGLDDEAFKKRAIAIIRDLEDARVAHQRFDRGGKLNREAYRTLAHAEELARLCDRIHNERLGQPPEIPVS